MHARTTHDFGDLRFLMIRRRSERLCTRRNRTRKISRNVQWLSLFCSFVSWSWFKTVRVWRDKILIASLKFLKLAENVSERGAPKHARALHECGERATSRYDNDCWAPRRAPSRLYSGTVHASGTLNVHPASSWILASSLINGGDSLYSGKAIQALYRDAARSNLKNDVRRSLLCERSSLQHA